MATRFYLPSSGSPAGSPSYDANWEDTSITTRLPTGTSLTNTAMTNVAFSDANDTNKDILFRQYSSPALGAQTLGTQTIKFQMRSFENSGLNNLFHALAIRVVGSDFTTERGTVLALTRDDVEMNNLSPSGTLENRQFTANSTSVTTQENDRLVIEIGYGGDPSITNTHSGTIRIGDIGTADLPEDDTTLSDFNPWIEFVSNISWAGGTPPAVVTAGWQSLIGVGN